jgi:hypothetical protein
MPKRTFTTEQIALLLRQIEVLMSQGNATPVAKRVFCRPLCRSAIECGALTVSLAGKVVNRLHFSIGAGCETLES